FRLETAVEDRVPVDLERDPGAPLEPRLRLAGELVGRKREDVGGGIQGPTCTELDPVEQLRFARYLTWRMPLLSAEALSLQYGGKVIFDDDAITVEPHDRLGIVGANGTGKSTLMRIL